MGYANQAMATSVARLGPPTTEHARTWEGSVWLVFLGSFWLILGGKSYERQTCKHPANKIQTVYNGWLASGIYSLRDLFLILVTYWEITVQQSSHPLPVTCWPIYKVILTHCSGISDLVYVFSFIFCISMETELTVNRAALLLSESKWLLCPSEPFVLSQIQIPRCMIILYIQGDAGVKMKKMLPSIALNCDSLCLLAASWIYGNRW